MSPNGPKSRPNGDKKSPNLAALPTKSTHKVRKFCSKLDAQLIASLGRITCVSMYGGGGTIKRKI